MPAKNSVKLFVEETYYHVYNRGVEKRVIFIDEQDYHVFLSLINRHLGSQKQQDKQWRTYENYRDRVELLAYCLMPNHFHFLFYLSKDTTSITELIRKISGSYTNYFNKKYERVGHLFQGVYKAKSIDTDAYLDHISRYIHLNPNDYKEWKFSSYSSYVGEVIPDWLKPQKVLDLFGSDIEEYKKFVADYLGQKKILDDLKYQLADE